MLLKYSPRVRRGAKLAVEIVNELYDVVWSGVLTADGDPREIALPPGLYRATIRTGRFSDYSSSFLVEGDGLGLLQSAVEKGLSAATFATIGLYYFFTDNPRARDLLVRVGARTRFDPKQPPRPVLLESEPARAGRSERLLSPTIERRSLPSVPGPEADQVAGAVKSPWIQSWQATKEGESGFWLPWPTQFSSRGPAEVRLAVPIGMSCLLQAGHPSGVPNCVALPPGETIVRAVSLNDKVAPRFAIDDRAEVIIQWAEAALSVDLPNTHADSLLAAIQGRDNRAAELLLPDLLAELTATNALRHETEIMIMAYYCLKMARYEDFNQLSGPIRGLASWNPDAAIVCAWSSLKQEDNLTAAINWLQIAWNLGVPIFTEGMRLSIAMALALADQLKSETRDRIQLVASALNSLHPVTSYPGTPNEPGRSAGPVADPAPNGSVYFFKL